MAWMGAEGGEEEEADQDFGEMPTMRRLSYATGGLPLLTGSPRPKNSLTSHDVAGGCKANVALEIGATLHTARPS